MHAELCPVCRGKGVVAHPNPLRCGETTSCHGCGGTGWITIRDDPPYIPIAKGEKAYKPDYFWR